LCGEVRRAIFPPGEDPDRGLVTRTLVDYAWLRSEAAERGIVVTREEAARLVEVSRREFPSPRAFRRFLRRSGMAVAALRFAVRHELLSEAIRKQVVAPARAGVTDAALEQFVRDYDAKWQDRTDCAPAYADHPRCGLTRDPRGLPSRGTFGRRWNSALERGAGSPTRGP